MISGFKLDYKVTKTQSLNDGELNIRSRDAWLKRNDFTCLIESWLDGSWSGYIVELVTVGEDMLEGGWFTLYCTPAGYKLLKIYKYNKKKDNKLLT